MKACRTSYLSVVAILTLLCSVSVFGRIATACPVGFSGSSTFTAAPGGSQIQTWTASDGLGFGNKITATVTSGSDMFTVNQSQIIIPAGGTATFTITFKPGANSTGTFKGTLTITDGCDKTFDLVGTVSSSGVANSLPDNVSFTITPNPATDNVNILSSGVRTAEIGIYDLLGKEIASSKTTNWKWDVASSPRRAAGSYIVRIVGESNSGEQFAIWRRIIIAR